MIELRNGEMVRDERRGGYGDTSGIPRLAPEVERGAAAVAALTAVLEVQREVAHITGPVEPLNLSEAVRAATATPQAATSPAATPPAAEAADASREPSTNTRSVPVTTPDVDALGLADRLGLADKKDRDDEVGPTT